MGSLLLKNIKYLLTSANSGPLYDVDVYIKGHTINKIGKHLPVENGQVRVINCSNHVVIPGLVNTHHHFYQTLTRNLPAVQNAKLFDWLVYLYEIWKKIDAEAIYYSSLLAIGELLKTGCTTTTDHHYLYPNSFTKDLMSLQFEAAETLGIRFSPTRGSMSLSKKDGGLPPDSVVQEESEILSDSQRVIEKFHDPSDFSMKKIVLAPCSPFSVTKNLMKESAELARSYNVRLHTHLAETADENDYCIQRYGKRPLALMEECGFIGSDVFYAHGIHFNDDELALLAKTKTGIAHCPSSNMRLGSGICRVKEMLDLGIPVGLGVDGSASNDSSDMLGEMRNSLLLQRIKYGSTGLTAQQAYLIGTENGAKILNFNKVGRIEEGWAADIAIYDTSGIEYAGSQSDSGASLIFSGYNHGTEYTIVQGNVVVDRGVLVGFDEDNLANTANSIAKKLLS